MSYVTLRVISSDLVLFGSLRVLLSSESAYAPRSRSPLSFNYIIFELKFEKCHKSIQVWCFSELLHCSTWLRSICRANLISTLCGNQLKPVPQTGTCLVFAATWAFETSPLDGILKTGTWSQCDFKAVYQCTR